VTVTGRVVLVRAQDSLPVPGARVVLHRVARAAQGPIDSTVTGAQGRFRFRFTPDTSAVYLVSSGRAGIEYFSTPLHVDPAAPDTALVVAVSDTSSAEPVVTISRHLVISRPARDGTRPALEIVVLGNPGAATRVSPDSLHPSWAGSLPPQAVGFQASSSDFSADAVVARHDSVLLFAPVAPGEKQVIYTYSLRPGPGTVVIPAFDSVGIFNVMLEEFDRTVRGGSIAKADSTMIEGRAFRQWAGAVPKGSRVEIDFPAATGQWVLPALVGAVALALLGMALAALRRRPAPAAGPLSALDRLARLDARYAGRQAQVPPEEWQRYQAERARLKAEASAELARSGPPS
jgi:hypothetical protein